MNPKIPKPYYKVSKNVSSQIKSSSKRNNKRIIPFILKKSKNYILESLAYNCPINSLRVKFHKWRGVNIGKNVMIGLKVTLDHSYPELITIEDDVSLAGNNYVLVHSNPYEHFANVQESFVAAVTIGKGAWVGIGATILPGVDVGEYSIIASSASVIKDVPPKTLVGGVPAKVLKDFSPLLENL